MAYHSFLICFHETQTDVYVSGQPVGQIINGVFVPHPSSRVDADELKSKVGGVLAAIPAPTTEHP